MEIGRDEKATHRHKMAGEIWCRSIIAHKLHLEVPKRAIYFLDESLN